ncbi:hypothetical protein IMCC9480_3739 [Oxalobacteraceae bacterium IMCC9480]|nr:hypothetical protein IMCC9480_3739 [Oxalobacteraceae bacterium IMCC9480]NDP58622.1 PepSY domain-containing protein [Oxalobacteraceae bacterium]
MQALTPKSAAMAAILVTLLASSAARADDDCVEPVSSWQPREVLRQKVEQRGWTVQRIKVDDGCYEVRGTDAKGNRFKAKYAPASLRIQALEIKFDKNADTAGYHLPGQ